MNLSELTRRTAFRIGSIFSGLFLVTVVVIFAVLYALMTREIEHKLRSHILEVRDTLVAVGDSGGFDALAKAVKRSARAPA